MWLNGKNGESMACPHQYVGVGACGSGQLGDCGDFISNKLKCCKTSAKISTFWCGMQRSRDSGVPLSCPGQMVVTSYCGSEAYRECKARGIRT